MQLVGVAITLVIILFLTMYRLPYYIYEPGNASALDPMIEVDQASNSEGDMHLVTVRGGQATPIYYLWSKIQPYHKIYPIEKIRQGLSDEEYNHIQLQYMDSSQDQAIAVAFQEAGLDVSYEFDGVYVTYVEDKMPASEVFQAGDQILSLDGHPVERTEDSIQYVEQKNAGDTIEVEIMRNGEEVTKNVELAPFPDDPEKIGMGVGLVTKRNIVTNPEVKINSEDIGGPSAGLMFSLEIYDQLTEEDYTKGYQVCGTGTISEEGKVGRIGGIDQKVVASDEDGCDLFFAPNEQGAENSDYKIAAETAERIETDMDIIPVDTFSEAVDYLKSLEPKG
ncbi:PDZ domain-containing protein [Salinibacillus xinjiangensis]|uniref:endopeptidase La n=2 Tax=Salinibacillus xinjiangensis TaxID=1229268 RepID=A0A6G1X3E5_9BACI|nr:PDZ domain-containing protein [Salinibacillus xinjiangensis]